MNQLCHYTFSNGATAQAVQVKELIELRSALQMLGLTQARPTLVLVGGASKISESDFCYLSQIFTHILAPLVESLGVTVVDGGTDAGIMRLMGQARSGIGGKFPLLGVAAIETVKLPGTSDSNGDRASLNCSHTHFILVPGDNWGDESPWLARIASLLAQDLPSMTLVINGGEITWQDVACSVQERRPTLILEGSGRTADQLAAALKGVGSDDRANTLIISGLLKAINMHENSHHLTQVLSRMLSKIPSGESRYH